MLNSHLFDQLLLRYRLIAWKQSPDPSLLDPYADSDVLRRHIDVLVEIQERANATGANFLLVPFDVTVQKGSPYTERYQRFVRACRERQIPVWPIDRIFDGLSYEALIVNGWDHHPNERGHRLVGEFLTEKMLSDKGVLARRAHGRYHAGEAAAAPNGVRGKT
jgi:hypothetical protein